jgi:four helix bundle protein
MVTAALSPMGANTYRELVCWQLADELQRRIIEITATPGASRDFRFCNQLRDASLSTVSNIAEGFARRSPPDFARLLTIAKGSIAETQVQLRAGLDRGYFDQKTVVELLILAARCDRVTSALRAYLWSCKNHRT